MHRTSNLDIIMTKSLERENFSVLFRDFNNSLSDHKAITVTIHNLEQIAQERRPPTIINKKYDYGTSRQLWSRLANSELGIHQIMEIFSIKQYQGVKYK